jgi:hypothetical protein
MLFGLSVWHGTIVQSQELAAPPSGVQKPETASAPTERRTIFGEPFKGRFNIKVEGSYQAEYDDNVFSSSSFRSGDWNNHFSGLLSATVQRKHLTWEAHYAPDYRAYNTYSSRDGLSQLFATSLDFLHSARTAIKFDGSVSDASTASLPTFSLASQGGTTVPIFYPDALQANARVFSSNGAIALSHRVSARSSWDASIHGGTMFYSKAPGLVSTMGQDSFSAGMDLGWNYSPSAQRTFGVEVGHQYFAFTSPSDHQQYDFVKGRYTHRFARRWELKLGAGPSVRNHLGGLNTTYAVDGSLTRQWERFQAGLAYDHGAGLSAVRGALTAETASGFLRYSRSERWNITTSFAHSQNEQIADRSLNTQSYSASFEGSYLFSRSFSGYARYSYVHQDSDLVSLLGNAFHRNLVSFGIRYTIRPLEGF